MNRVEVVKKSLSLLLDNGIEVVDDIHSLDAYICSIVSRILAGKYGDINLMVESVTNMITEKYLDILASKSIIPEYETQISGVDFLQSNGDVLQQRLLTEASLKKLLNDIELSLVVTDDSVFRESLVIFQRVHNLNVDQMSGQFGTSHSMYTRWINGRSAPRKNERKEDIFRKMQEYPTGWLV